MYYCSTPCCTCWKATAMRKFSLWHIWEISMENTQIKIISIWSRQFSNFHMPLVSCVFGLWSSGKRELRLNDFVYKHISPFCYHHFHGIFYNVSDSVNNFLGFSSYFCTHWPGKIVWKLPEKHGKVKVMITKGCL